MPTRPVWNVRVAVEMGSVASGRTPVAVLLIARGSVAEMASAIRKNPAESVLKIAAIVSGHAVPEMKPLAVVTWM